MTKKLIGITIVGIWIIYLFTAQTIVPAFSQNHNLLEDSIPIVDSLIMGDSIVKIRRITSPVRRHLRNNQTTGQRNPYLFNIDSSKIVKLDTTNVSE